MHEVNKNKWKLEIKKKHDTLGFCEFYGLILKEEIYITYKNTISNTICCPTKQKGGKKKQRKVTFPQIQREDSSRVVNAIQKETAIPVI